jgi:hypothetical protein
LDIGYRLLQRSAKRCAVVHFVICHLSFIMLPTDECRLEDPAAGCGARELERCR